MVLASGRLVFIDIDKDLTQNLYDGSKGTLLRERADLIQIFNSGAKPGDVVPLGTAGSNIMILWMSCQIPEYNLASIGIYGQTKDVLDIYRTAISTFLDEADAGGTPSYDSLRAVLKTYKQNTRL